MRFIGDCNRLTAVQRIFLVLFCCFIFAIGYSFLKHMIQPVAVKTSVALQTPYGEQIVDNDIRHQVDFYKKQLPIQLDERTAMVDFFLVEEQRKIVAHYVVSLSQQEKAQKDALKNMSQDFLLKDACNDKDTKLFMKYGYSVETAFFESPSAVTNDGYKDRMLFSIFLNNDICQKYYR